MGDRRNKKKQGTVDTTAEGDTDNNTGDSKVDTVANETRTCEQQQPFENMLQTLSSLLLKQEELRVQANLEFKKREQLMEVERKEREEVKERERREREERRNIIEQEHYEKLEILERERQEAMNALEIQRQTNKYSWKKDVCNRKKNFGNVKWHLKKRGVRVVARKFWLTSWPNGRTLINQRTISDGFRKQ